MVTCVSRGGICTIFVRTDGIDRDINNHARDALMHSPYTPDDKPHQVWQRLPGGVNYACELFVPDTEDDD